ncbi:MAG: biopolymer transporter ExbD, partial [Sedimentisphaerales bacterium]|nr:biopolymer transporter ExbD [Sedimentisphaerales bacterium]
MRRIATRKSKNSIQARMVPLIDVVFLLLIFFIMTVNFSQQEGFLAAELPANAHSATSSEIDPLAVYIISQQNGDCQIAIGNEAVIIPQGAD